MKENILNKFLIEVCEATEATTEDSKELKAECLAYVRGLSVMAYMVLKELDKVKEESVKEGEPVG